MNTLYKLSNGVVFAAILAAGVFYASNFAQLLLLNAMKPTTLFVGAVLVVIALFCVKEFRK